MITEKYKANIAKIYTFDFFTMFLVFVPVIVPYFMHLGLSMEEIFIIQAFFGLSMVICEVPSAYLGDLWGRKNVLILGSLLNAIGFSFLIIAEDFWSLLIYEFLLGVGTSFISGANISLLYDSLGDQRELKARSLGIQQSVALVGEAIAALLCSLLMVYGFTKVIYAQVLFAWFPLFIAVTLTEPYFEKMSRHTHSENLKEVLSHVFKADVFLRSIFINLTIWALSTFFAVWIVQKYWKDAGIELYHMGYLWMVCNLIAAITGKYAHQLEKRFGARAVLSIMALLPVTAYITMGSIQGIAGLIVTLLFYISRGLNMVIMREAFNHRVPAKFRNTANSLTSLFFRLGFFVFGPLIGYSIDKFGLAFSLKCIGISFLILFVTLLVPMLKMIHSQEMKNASP